MNPGMRTKLCHAGALSTAGTVAAMIFCCLPFATGILGAGLAAFGARFAPLRPYLATVSVALLGYSFYQAYAPGVTTCIGEMCDAPASTRFRRVTVWMVASAVVLLLTASWWADWVIYWTL